MLIFLSNNRHFQIVVHLGHFSELGRVKGGFLHIVSESLQYLQVRVAAGPSKYNSVCPYGFQNKFLDK